MAPILQEAKGRKHAKAREYMDAQEQAKVSDISKKPNVRFSAIEHPQPDRI